MQHVGATRVFVCLCDAYNPFRHPRETVEGAALSARISAGFFAREVLHVNAASVRPTEGEYTDATDDLQDTPPFREHTAKVATTCDPTIRIV